MRGREEVKEHREGREDGWVERRRKRNETGRKGKLLHRIAKRSFFREGP